MITAASSSANAVAAAIASTLPPNSRPRRRATTRVARKNTQMPAPANTSLSGCPPSRASPSTAPWASARATVGRSAKRCAVNSAHGSNAMTFMWPWASQTIEYEPSAKPVPAASEGHGPRLRRRARR